MNVPFLLVGGVPLRFYTSSKFQRRFGSGKNKITDVDIVFLKIPSQIKQYLQEEPLVKKMEAYVGLSEVKKRIVLSGVGTVFHAKENCREELLTNACFFEGRVGRIILSKDDFRERTHYMIANGKEVIVLPLASPSLLIATCINPDAITEERIRRCLLAFLSLMKMKKEPNKYAYDVLNKALNRMLSAGYSRNEIFIMMKKFVRRSKVCGEEYTRIIYDAANKIMKKQFSIPLPWY